MPLSQGLSSPSHHSKHFCSCILSLRLSSSDLNIFQGTSAAEHDGHLRVLLSLVLLSFHPRTQPSSHCWQRGVAHFSIKSDPLHLPAMLLPFTWTYSFSHSTRPSQVGWSPSRLQPRWTLYTQLPSPRLLYSSPLSPAPSDSYACTADTLTNLYGDPRVAPLHGALPPPGGGPPCHPVP